MDLVTPAIGLVFWTVLIFLILLLLLRAFAWKPILNAVDERNESIKEALAAADKAKEEMIKLQADNDMVLKEARIERDKIIKEARELKEKTISEAKVQAKTEADALVTSAKAAIENEKRNAINAIKNEMANLSVQIAEKILEQELSDKEKQKRLIEDMLNKTNIN
ncbi:MAG TPA: ATP synthase F0 subunit B [Marinilabiliales bacterium]|jgi:F-type H+-transporting ATPase subunit b|nr:F0F1 ATP synthase subunit B [Salinivirgaceae bacterium]OFX39351.1 MAG: ATP synthase F0 subunit B [Bacteroidetes bacterium GWA2_40_14]OFX56927.1 MAG: ATP synthase F0 subunit B [Bacteroidetes bacterium GWC2_40_13]OFX71666.1 MAG: ATP synthase F0 subunit B [Bacteroidetes bacterium GWD2_40_43]OFX90205.1 MAG: ATP synthase F0 subunit B [Bacteroidetes bacterium GWE2_40_63]OFY18649.1 MAG: ATP synthase F0 subunit B [Bacteroidetes bacterium GWF2_40_13]OFZ27668.1 MAG: ATP synthase F0 subunit B [Bacter